MMKPDLRFKGGHGYWKKKKLIDEVNLYSGLTYSPNDICDQGTLVLRSSNVQEGELSFLDNVYVKPQIINSSNVEEGDIIVVVRNGSRALIGKHAVIKHPMKNTVIGAFMAGLRPKNTQDSNFMNALLSSKRFDDEVTKNLGATINQITNGTFCSIEFLFPDNEERSYIGTYFKSLDTLIQSTTKKITSLKQLKSASLLSMFPQAEETKPHIRFNGFKEDWEKDYASELFITYNDRNRSDLPVLSACQDIRGMTPRNESGYEISHNKSNEVTYKRVQPGQFVIHLRSFQGGFSHSSVEGITSPAYTVFGFKNIKKHDSYFWKIIFMSKDFIKRLETITYGIRDGRSISFEDFSKMVFVFPSYNEQQSIASFFRKLDTQISLQEKKLEKLKQIKSACLDKMFV